MKKLLTILLLLLLLPFTSMMAQDNDVRITHFSEADGFMQSPVNYAIQDRQGFIWLCTWNGLYQYDGYRFYTYKMLPGDHSPLKTNRFSTIREVNDQQMECTTTDSLFFIFHRDSKTFQQTAGDYSKHPRPYKADTAVEEKVRSLPLFKSFFRVVLVDRQGGIWVHTHSGLYRIWFSHKPLRPVMAGSRAEEEVCALHVDKQQRLWVADKNGYVRIGERYLSFNGIISTTPVPFGKKVYCIFEDSQGDVWLGAKPEGLTRLTPVNEGRYNVRHYVHDDNDRYSLSCNNIYDIAEDAQQRLWIATYHGGLNMFDLHDKHEVFLHSGNSLTGWPKDEESSKMHCLYITPQQVLIAGTLNGIYTSSLKDSPQHMKFYHSGRRKDDATSLGNNWVMDIQPAGPHTIAIATMGGGVSFTSDDQLLRDNIRFRTWMNSDGLASDVCMQLYYHADKSLYVVSETAISRITLNDSTVTNYIRGTLADYFNFLEAKPVATADGQLHFGTTHGVLSVSSDDLHKSSFNPPIVFACPDTIRLSSDERNITIHFAALDYNKNVPVTYAYRIDGMTDDWSYITDNHITLPDIPAGTYQLHLRSTNGDGVWCDNERVLMIHRKAAFNETPYAWMLYGLLLALIVIGALRAFFYIRRLQNEIKDIHLTSNQRIEVLSERVRELLSIKENVEPISQEAEIENDDDRDFVTRAKTYVAKNLSNENFSVADFARDMGVSRTVLFARMKSIFNTSPNNYLLNQRIEQAKHLLQQPGAYIADIAYRCGFSDPKYFSKCFKKISGMTPSEFQKAKQG